LKPKLLKTILRERFSRQWFLVQLLKTCARGATSCSWVLTKETAPARNWRWQGHIRYIVDSTRRLEQASYRNSNSNRATRSAKVPCESLTTPQFPPNLPPNSTAGLFQQFSVRSSCSPDPQECTNGSIRAAFIKPAQSSGAQRLLQQATTSTVRFTSALFFRLSSFLGTFLIFLAPDFNESCGKSLTYCRTKSP
jgi:hypothetical protein